MSKYVTRSQWKHYRNESPFQQVDRVRSSSVDHSRRGGSINAVGTTSRFLISWSNHAS